MLEFFWGCLIVGILFSVMTVIFGDMVGHWFDVLPEPLQPMVIIGGITAFGGSGLLLGQYTSFAPMLILLLSLMAAVLLSVIVYFFYVRPMQNAENSTSYSMSELTGKIAEVTIPIPAEGYGEVMLKIGATRTNEIAASFDRVDIQAGTRVVIIEVKDHTLYVSRFENT
ncbi:NfeD family protein [Ammoniphilus sp. CFH 90114]|uniref:NfeD family protein n=1 Tax=Ammoniphilus sp. CFH 90114 TaxID=2493665 RepID=UPI00100E1703|nr:NfeD family protein [Ammoniphilus sp. CFH 90114]RXT06244.1 protease [Ammoniphilus sp. CFH 90114]